MKYRLKPREIPRGEPGGFPEGLGDISSYTPPLVTIQLQCINLLQRTKLYYAAIITQ